MIRRIQHIKSFGVFDDFQWPNSLPEFKQFNLIYGWNYSGKTTLSRAFRCFEQKQPHVDFAGAQVQLKDQDGAVHHLSVPHTAPVFRVFNSDFVSDNLSFEAGSATPVLVLGAEDIEKQEALKAKAAERKVLSLSIEANKRNREDRQSAIEKALRDYARDFIKNPLSVPNYDKTRFEPKVIECKFAPGKYLLGDDALAECLAVYRSTDKKPTLSTKVLALSPVADLTKKAASILARVVTSNIQISRLKENPAVEKWVKDGRPLHDGKDACQFCGQPLPADLMAHLAGHFSADYDDLMSELKSAANSIQVAQKDAITLDHKSDFYSELSERFTAEKDQLDELLEARRAALKSLDEAMTVKQTKAFTSLECPAVDDPDPRIVSAVQAINKIIAEHNYRTAEFDRNRQEVFTKLEKHYAALFVGDQKYNEQLQQIEGLNTTITGQAKKINELDVEIRTLEQALSEASKGAERINELLAAYFGKNDLRIKVSADKRFQIIRDGVIAKNLSEGEKTAIAFAHFITRVQDGRHPLADTRVVIDDPISSLDTNHLFNTYALIKTQLSDCCQLFISTHSFEFYNLIREWVGDDEKDTKKPQADWKKWGIFLVKRTDSGKSELEEIPKVLLKFKSEYHYLFSTLYHFEKNGADDFDNLLSLPNVVRRFMEAFGGIMIPLSTGLRGKMERLFSDPVERERVWKFINYYSHNTTITRSLTIPDTSECKAVVQACLKAVSEWNAQYYADLESEVG
ncbi:AAA family ATPase [Sulfuriferula sp. GW1]|uniref:AAA family ATPase n=1 Tax=Sulfuriferula sp. GW1 TaxID=3345111 RepID=UPI0039B09332